MKSDIEQANIEMRRARVLELKARGKTQAQIAQELGVTQGLISLDLKALRNAANEQIKTYIEDILPEQHQIARVGLLEVIKEAWKVSEDADEQGTKLAALKLAKECYEAHLAMLGDINIIDKTVKDKEAIKKQLEELKKKPKAEAAPGAFVPVV